MDQPTRADHRRALTQDRRSGTRLGVPAALLATGLLGAACAAESQPPVKATAEAPTNRTAEATAEPGAPTDIAPELPTEESPTNTYRLIADLFEEDRVDAALEELDAAWQPSLAAALVDFLRVSYEQQQPGFRETSFAVIELLEAKSGESFGGSISAWYRWLWEQETSELPDAARIKSVLFERIDPRFARYFGLEGTDGARDPWEPWPRTVRLDEVRWGGVEQDGIPPLRSPRNLKANEAHYLADSDIVYGVTAHGEARAYPRRILGWHELVTDRLGGEDIAGVYCTLCGTMIVYDTLGESGLHQLGTSGFLYRSNKLMYDEATQSLWSTLFGIPVIGSLVGTDTQLPRRSVVATTWGEWKTRHPGTTVLDLDTGHVRDYTEGAAYADYYATDELMFDVSARDARLPNKAEVIGIAAGPTASVKSVNSIDAGPRGAEVPTLALPVSYLREHPTHVEEFAGHRFVYLTDATGAVRVYGPLVTEPFRTWQGGASLVDASGAEWNVSEDALERAAGTPVPRAESTRAFWFAWFAAHPDTELRTP